jgi:hypothetical protein
MARSGHGVCAAVAAHQLISTQAMARSGHGVCAAVAAHQLTYASTQAITRSGHGVCAAGKVKARADNKLRRLGFPWHVQCRGVDSGLGTRPYLVRNRLANIVIKR